MYIRSKRTARNELPGEMERLEYRRLTAKDAINLAAMHTWPASVFPAALGALLSVGLTGRFSLPMFALSLAAVVLMQSSVNTINDYYDFVRGNDRPEDEVDPSDAVLVHNNINPQSVFRLGLGFLGAALLCGVWPAVRGGAFVLGAGLFGGLVILLYSAGRRPISFLPLGEVVSGTVMGGLIPAAVFAAINGYVSVRVFLLTAPLVLGVGLIMMTNNLCDMERDAPAGRHTLPLVLGRGRAAAVYRGTAVLWFAFTFALVALFFPKGALVSAAVLVCATGSFLRILRAPLTQAARGPCMGAILKGNLWLGSAYLLGIVAHILKK